jgi:hypothetical protein
MPKPATQTIDQNGETVKMEHLELNNFTNIGKGYTRTYNDLVNGRMDYRTASQSNHSLTGALKVLTESIGTLVKCKVADDVLQQIAAQYCSMPPRALTNEKKEPRRRRKAEPESGDTTKE